MGKKYVSNKLGTVSFHIYKASSILDYKSLNKSIYIIVLYTYCLLLWNIGKHIFNNYSMFIFTTKRVIRNVTHSEYLASTNEYIKLNVLKLRDIVKYKSYLFAFK